jgi:hypothetical protein
LFFSKNQNSYTFKRVDEVLGILLERSKNPRCCVSFDVFVEVRVAGTNIKMQPTATAASSGQIRASSRVPQQYQAGLMLLRRLI